MTGPRHIMTRDPFTLVVGDITTLTTDAIVNAANPQMLGGGGVDGTIHRAAGPGLLRECREIAQSLPGVRCPTGEARITGAYDLDAKCIIHTVGPVYSDHPPPKAATLLASCYEHCLQLAHDHQLHRIAFPCISTGLFGYPKAEAAEVALNAIRAWLKAHGPNITTAITICCFLDTDAMHYERLLPKHF